MSATDWKIYVRDSNLQRIAEIDDYASLECIAKFNDVGSYQLTMDRRQPIVQTLLQPGVGITVVHDDSASVLLSGPIAGIQHTRDDTTNSITLTGVDDNVWIKRRVAHPSPTETLPPYDVAEHHEVSGVCSTVLRTYVNMQLGPGAIPARRVPGLVLGTDPVAGSTVSGKLRWTPLLDELKELALAGGDIGFRIVQVDETLEFQTYQPVDRTATAMFSEDFGNLAGYEFKTEAPETNYVFCAGQGEGTARTIREGQNTDSVAVWGRLEEFVDRRDVEDAEAADQLQQKIDEVLLEKGQKAELKLTPIDTDGLAYGVHYGLGDKVTVVVAGPELFPDFEGIMIQEVMREAKLKLEPQGLNIITPTIGDPSPNDVFRVFTELKRHAARLANLEKR